MLPAPSLKHMKLSIQTTIARSSKLAKYFYLLRDSCESIRSNSYGPTTLQTIILPSPNFPIIAIII